MNKAKMCKIRLNALQSKECQCSVNFIILQHMLELKKKTKNKNKKKKIKEKYNASIKRK